MNSLRSALTAVLTSQRGNEEVEAEIRSGTPDRPSLQTCGRGRVSRSRVLPDNPPARYNNWSPDRLLSLAGFQVTAIGRICGDH
jgi:hypothetical protein